MKNNNIWSKTNFKILNSTNVSITLYVRPAKKLYPNLARPNSVLSKVMSFFAFHRNDNFSSYFIFVCSLRSQKESTLFIWCSVRLRCWVWSFLRLHGTFLTQCFFFFFYIVVYLIGFCIVLCKFLFIPSCIYIFFCCFLCSFCTALRNCVLVLYKATSKGVDIDENAYLS